ncbi:MAG TPA: serine/threonine-protein kinase [Kofleriaceae bacterium]|nr:serine/threonine-protein kinase [Kofleriaceae bacterium]
MGAGNEVRSAGRAVLARRYEVQGSLGRGGMGTVYRAVDRATGSLVAVKLLESRNEEHPTSSSERFAREIGAIQQLGSPHSVRLLDAGTLGGGRHFMVMEHLEGADLHQILDRVHRLPMQRAVRLVRQACAAIGEAHALGIVHRDIKPANLFVTQLADGSDCLKVLDFGISKLPAATMEELALTVTGAVLGSPVYMSPEQMTCSRDVDARTDIWSLGIVLYQCLSGGFPYEADGVPQLCARVLTEAPIPLSARVAVPRALEAVVMRCLARDPERRFARAEDLAAALLPFAEDGAAPTTILVRPERMPMPSPPPRMAMASFPPRMGMATLPPLAPAPAPGPGRFALPPPEESPDTSRLIYLAGAFIGVIAGIAYFFLAG